MVDQVNPPEEAWVAATVEALRATESWTGRLHMHKHLFIAEVLGLASPPFQFELYRYGPYSFDLDRCIAEMEGFGLLNKEFKDPGYGARYSVSSLGRPLIGKLPDRARQAVRRVADAIGALGSKELELVATCLWVNKREGMTESSTVVESVGRIKPRYNSAEITEALTKARAVEATLLSDV